MCSAKIYIDYANLVAHDMIVAYKSVNTQEQWDNDNQQISISGE